MINNAPTRHVSLVIMNNILGSSISTAIEMLEAAMLAGRALKIHKKTRPLTVETVAATEHSVTLMGGMIMEPQRTVAEVKSTDLIFIPALWRNPQPILQQNTAIIEWLKQQYAQGALICAVGTGVCLPAAAGLLNNKPATTHWYYLDTFEKHYPEVLLNKQYLQTAADRIYCAGSVNAGADLIIHLINHYFGSAIAGEVEKQFSPEIRRNYEHEVYSLTGELNHDDECIMLAQTWLRNNYQNEVNIKALAEHVDMSARNFDRRFKKAVNSSPSQYLRKIRLDEAKSLLRTSNLAITEVAALVGYNDPAYFSRLFSQRYRTSPSSYRQQVRAKMFSSML